MRHTVPVTYRVEERSVQTGQTLGTCGRHTVDRDEALQLWELLTKLDAVCEALFGPYGPRRLVLVAVPALSAPLNAAATEDLRAAIPAAVAQRVLDEVDTILAERQLVLVPGGAR